MKSWGCAQLKKNLKLKTTAIAKESEKAKLTGRSLITGNEIWIIIMLDSPSILPGRKHFATIWIKRM